MHTAHEADDKDLDLRYSLGFFVDDDQATIGYVIPRSPADAAGASPGSHIIGLNGYKWSKTLEIQYAGGERYPDLSRVPGSTDVLSEIAHSRTPQH